MSLSFKICSNSLANLPQCLSSLPVFLGLSYYFRRIFHGFGIFFMKIEINLDPNFSYFHGHRDSFSTKVTTK